MAFGTVTYTFSNNATADATQVNTNFANIISITSDGTKDFNIANLTCTAAITGSTTLTLTGAATFNGAVTLGSGHSNIVTVNGALANTIPVAVGGNYLYTLTLPTATPASTSYVTMSPTGALATTLTVAFSASQVLCDTPSGHGGTNTCVRIFTNHTSTGSDITYATSVANGDSFTINTVGIYLITYSDQNTGAAKPLGISVNSSQLSTDIRLITTANRLALTSNPSGAYGSVSVAYRAAVNDVIRAHDDGTMNINAAAAQFSIVRIG